MVLLFKSLCLLKPTYSKLESLAELGCACLLHLSFKRSDSDNLNFAGAGSTNQAGVRNLQNLFPSDIAGANWCSFILTMFCKQQCSNAFQFTGAGRRICWQEALRDCDQSNNVVLTQMRPSCKASKECYQQAGSIEYSVFHFGQSGERTNRTEDPTSRYFNFPIFGEASLVKVPLVELSDGTPTLGGSSVTFLDVLSVLSNVQAVHWR